MSPALDGYLLIDEGEVIVYGDVVHYSPKTLHWYVLRHMGLIQYFYQQA